MNNFLFSRFVFKLQINGVITGKTYTKFLRDLNNAYLFKPKALAVIVNSPGGTAVHADLIYRNIKAYSSLHKIPVLTFAEDLAASGGYYIMCAGDELFASSPLSLFGSIGAVSSLPNIKDLASKYGIERRHYSTSSMDFFSIYDPLEDYTAAKSKKVSTVLKEVNDEFRRVVLTNRKGKITVPDEKINDLIFNGDVFHTEKAIEYGLIDGHGRCNEVIKDRFPETRILGLDSDAYGLRKVYQTLKEKISN
ncbi:hypothetical protein SteCoe_8325 [Stentor coeruleus]|uniref:Peptidase S49 domain-containing protein n=1 Tax=Stentor coeruleus TaxID=5963 RepID=A0A1R2CKN3_9CILI|nr:hypothetical protein SteCoe_8325 [Stentor coeruleus]